MSDDCDAGAIEAFNLAIDNDIERTQAYFYRAVCYYRLGNYRQSKNDMEAAALLGCQDALFWSKFETKKRSAGITPTDRYGQLNIFPGVNGRSVKESG